MQTEKTRCRLLGMQPVATHIIPVVGTLAF